MSSQKTNNLNLHQWESGDAVSRAEFNENFQKLDADSAAIRTKYDGETAAIRGELAVRAEVRVGSYVGDGAERRFIDLGYAPRALLVMDEYGVAGVHSSGGTSIYGGLALPGAPVAVFGESAVEPSGTGFYVGDGSPGSYAMIATNRKQIDYRYLAVL